MTKTEKFQLLANMATVRARLDILMSTSRSSVSIDKLHAIQAKAKELDTEIINLLLDNKDTASTKADADEIAIALKNAKAELIKSGKISAPITTSVTDRAVVVNPPTEDVVESINTTKPSLSVTDGSIMVNPPSDEEPAKEAPKKRGRKAKKNVSEEEE